MRCEEIRALMDGYHQGSLDEYTRIKIHHHLVQCPTCTEEYDIWLRGEDYIHSKPLIPTTLARATSPKVRQSVMDRIQREEKWANPSLEKRKPRYNRVKLLATFLLSMFCIITIFYLVTSLAPDTQVPIHVIRLSSESSELPMDTVVIHEHQQTEETSLDFQVVSSLKDPIVYTAAAEKTKPPQVLILAIFSILIIILGLSWITRI